MRIGIDARMMGPEIRGIGRYVERLLAHLAAAAPEHEFTVFTRPEAAHLVPAGMKTVPVKIKWYGLAEQFKLGKIFDAEKLDLVHVPHWNAPWTLKTPLAVTIHDMILWEHPTLASTTLHPLVYWAKYFFYRLIVSRNAKRAKIVFTVSESAKNAILRNLNTAPEKIIVTPNGLMPFLGPDAAALPAETKNKRYVLSVSSGYPHKNLPTFLKTAKELLSADPALYAVIAGSDPSFIGKLKKQATEIAGDLAGRIIFLGVVPDAELEALYRGADALIFTSKAEGFGIPLLEAAAADCPIVASNIDTSRETADGAAVFVAPDDVAGYVAAYRKIASDPALKNTLISAGKGRAAAFRWQETARRTANGYNRVFSTR